MDRETSPDLRGGPDAPPGWYPDPEGNARYWDGNNWLPMEPPRPSRKLAAEQAKTERLKRLVFAVVLLAATLVLALVGLAAWKVVSASHKAEQAAIAEQERKHQAAVQREAERREAEEQEQKQAEADKKVDKLVEDYRRELIVEIEAEVKATADQQLSEGILNEPVIGADCDAIGNITGSTSFISCLAVIQELDDGSLDGYSYWVDVDWDRGTYTIELLSP